MSKVFRKPYALYTIRHTNSFQPLRTKSTIDYFTSKQSRFNRNNNSCIRHYKISKQQSRSIVIK